MSALTRGGAATRFGDASGAFVAALVFILHLRVVGIGLDNTQSLGKLFGATRFDWIKVARKNRLSFSLDLVVPVALVFEHRMLHYVSLLGVAHVGILVLFAECTVRQLCNQSLWQNDDENEHKMAGDSYPACPLLSIYTRFDDLRIGAIV